MSVSLGYGVRRMTERHLGNKLGFAQVEAIRILLFSAIYAPVVYMVTDALMGVEVSPNMVFWELFILIGLICTIMSAIGYFILGIGIPEPPFRPRLADRLPDGAQVRSSGCRSMTIMSRSSWKTAAITGC
ncbi:hypothetical protein [Marivivens marinus]|uniref:hypothetical protein n=1 Tax=Marivivens marinus TaxID=3110173 RepID=UPI003B845407